MSNDEYLRPAEVDAETWGHIEEVWNAANQGLDQGIAAYRRHRDATNCPHPTCVGADFAEAVDRMEPHIMKGLLHAAIHRLEVMRLEKEAGL